MRFKMLFVLGLIAAALLSACDGDNSQSKEPIDESSVDVSIDQGRESSFPYIDNTELSEDGNGVYSIADFSISLPQSFVRQQVDDLALYATDNEKSSVVLSVESYYNMTVAGMDTTMDAKEYAKNVVKSQEDLQTPVYDHNGGAYFEYVQDLGSDQYRYFAYAYKGENAFYLLQFCCNENDTETQRAFFEEIEKTVKVSS